MTRFQALTMIWMDGTMSERQMDEFRTQLEAPENRATWVRELRLNEGLTEFFASRGAAGGYRAAESARGKASLSRWGFWMPIAAAASLLAAAGLWLANDRSGTHRSSVSQSLTITDVAGLVVFEQDGAWLAARTGMALDNGSGIRTGADSRALLECVGKGHRIQLKADTHFSIKSQGEFHLAHGRIVASLPSFSRQTLVFTTSRARAEVIGTRFELEARPELTKLTVAEGQMKLTDLKTNRSVAVPAGHRAMVVPGLPLQAVPEGTDIPSAYAWNFSEPPDPESFKIHKGGWRHIPDTQCMEISDSEWVALVNTPLHGLPVVVEWDVSASLDGSAVSFGSISFDKFAKATQVRIRDPLVRNVSRHDQWTPPITIRAYVLESSIILTDDNDQLHHIIFYDDYSRGSRLLFTKFSNHRNRIHRFAVRSVRAEDIPDTDIWRKALENVTHRQGPSQMADPRPNRAKQKVRLNFNSAPVKSTPFDY